MSCHEPARAFSICSKPLRPQDPCVADKKFLIRKQVLLRERCLLVVSGDAYTRCEHSIPTRTKDAIAATCCNARQARLHLLLDASQSAAYRCLQSDTMRSLSTEFPLHLLARHITAQYRWQLLISGLCFCQAGAAAGDSIMRAERRVSLVFVHKRFRSAVEDSDM